MFETACFLIGLIFGMTLVWVYFSQVSKLVNKLEDLHNRVAIFVSKMA